ncbi:MAG: hypothetical protein QF659_07910, partial [Dehalococcoidia bacterium]|nr:hypothetical protein [Dehalococcoidia bacterium]
MIETRTCFYIIRQEMPALRDSSRETILPVDQRLTGNEPMLRPHQRTVVMHRQGTMGCGSTG